MSLSYQTQYKAFVKKTQIKNQNKILTLQSTHVLEYCIITYNCVHKDFYRLEVC